MQQDPTPFLYDHNGHRMDPGGAAALVRKPGGELAPTVFPLPVRPLSELTPQMRRRAVEATYTGRIEEAVDLYRQVVTENGYFAGILATMAHGILGMPRTYQGRADMVEALDNAGGTPSEDRAMHPESEAAQIFADGIGFGIGYGKRIYSDAPRAYGANRLPRLEWRDPRWLWRNPVSLQWYETKRDGMRPIYPGDGETFMFCPYPDLDVWRHGPWLYLTLAGIFERDSEFDRQRVSEVTTPTPVMRAEKGTSKEARKEALERLRDLAHDHRIVLPEQWIYEIVSADGTYNDVTTAIVDWAIGMAEVGLTGNRMGIQAQSAFTDANVYKRTTTDRRRFFAGAWCDTERRDSLIYWGADNYGDPNVPIIHIDVESPEDKLAAGKADEQDGKALVAMADGYAAVGYELDPRYIEERAQRRGIRIRPLAQPVVVPKAPGTPPGTPGIAGGLGGGGGAPTTPAEAPPPGGADQRKPQPDDEYEDDDDAYRLAAQRADAMNAQGHTACRHNRTNLCRTCGVRGNWQPDGAGGWRVSWSAVGARKPVAA